MWYWNAVLGKNNLGTIINNISSVCKLSRAHTNHSVRATAVTVMYHAGIDTKQICKITKHKTEESLKHYIENQTTEQKCKCAEALSAGLSATEICISDQSEQSSNSQTINSYRSTNTLTIPTMGNHTFNLNITEAHATSIFVTSKVAVVAD